MNNSAIVVRAAVVASAAGFIVVAQLAGGAPPGALDAARPITRAGGTPDLITGALSAFANFGADGNGHLVYSFGTETCNAGAAQAAWVANTNQHPVIGQNMFRVAPLNGHPRIEQLGQSWLKHTYFALAGNTCGLGCQAIQGDPGTALGVGCSTPYSAANNASQSMLGAKSEVNPSTGAFPYPPTHPTSDGTNSYGRLRVNESDMLPGLNPGAAWFAEAQHVHPQDSPAQGGAANNASYRRLNILATGAVASFAAPTARELPAVRAWAELDPTIAFTQIDVPGDGTFFVGYRAWDNGNGTWDYEVAVQNHNSDRAGGSFTVPIPAGVTVSNVGFHDVDYHSGEPYDNTDWVMTVGADSLTWTSPQTYDQNPDSNALRWGTLYNFRFTADAPPAAVTASLALFKPGAPQAIDVTVLGPQGTPGACAADITGPGNLPDGNVDALDFLVLLAQWGTPCTGSCSADITGPVPLTPDGNIDALDFLLLIAQWGSPAACP